MVGKGGKKMSAEIRIIMLFILTVINLLYARKSMLTSFYIIVTFLALSTFFSLESRITSYIDYQLEQPTVEEQSTQTTERTPL